MNYACLEREHLNTCDNSSGYQNPPSGTRPGSAFHIDLICQIQILFGSGSKTGAGFWWQNIVKFYRLKKFQNCYGIYLFLGLHEGRPSYRRSLHLTKENIRNSKHKISYFFSIVLGHLCPLDPDPTDQRQCESGSKNTVLPPLSPSHLPIKWDTSGQYEGWRGTEPPHPCAKKVTSLDLTVLSDLRRRWSNVCCLV